MKKICREGMRAEDSDDAEAEALAEDMVWAQVENVSAQTAVIGNLTKEAFLVIQ